MFLFNFVVEHWLASLIYIVFFWWTVSRFMDCVYDHPPKWYKFLYWVGIPIWGRKSGLFPRACLYPFRITLRIAEIVVGYVLAIPLFLILRLVDFAEWREDKERQKRQTEANIKAMEWRRQTEEKNQLKALQRRDWFAGNKPTLYFNTVSGVTAVLRPADYERAKRDTQNARTNELWAHNVLKPARETFTFVTKSGGELIQANCDHARRYKVTGWLSDLHEICQAADCSLVRDEAIFVPWVNETLVSFQEQVRILMDCNGQASAVELIDKQAPSELQPLAVH